MKYQKGYKQIQRGRAVKRLKGHLPFIFGVLLFLLVLGVVGALAG